MAASHDVVVRRAARVLLVDDEDRVLLVRFRDPSNGASFWAMPGGGVEEGEADEAAARRELQEETGLRVEELGGVIWTREHGFEWGGRRIFQRERFYFARTGSFEVAQALRSELLAEDVVEHRWWTLDELRTTREDVAPRRLAELTSRILSDGPPAIPFDAGR